MENAARYLANPDVSCRKEGPGEGAILFNPDTDAIMVVNATGLLIWQALEKPQTGTEIVTFLLDNCDGVPTKRVATDVETFLQTMQPGGFIGQVLKDETY